MLFCGDGIDDAIGVVQVDTGVQIGGTPSNITRTSANVVLLNERLGNLLYILEISSAPTIG